MNSKENYENDENEEILEGKIIELQKKLDEIRRKNHKISKITTNITANEPRFTQKEEENNNNIEKDSTKMLLDLLDEKINN